VSAAVLYNNGFKVCFGAAAPTPVRGRMTEEKLNSLDEITEEKLIPVLDTAALDVLPISDIRASREYRIEMVKVALKRAVMQAYEALKN
jgi:carbon-monoxide dehydrogenase medium subunit